jgi:hypothetical protein
VRGEQLHREVGVTREFRVADRLVLVDGAHARDLVR